MTARFHYKRKHTYATRSNIVKRFRTPGGKLSMKYLRKGVNPVKCGDTGLPLQGIVRLVKSQFKNTPKRKRTVSRTYGGTLTGEAVRHRILRAFFNEELKCIKHGSNLPSKRAAKRRQGRGKK